MTSPLPDQVELDTWDYSVLPPMRQPYQGGTGEQSMKDVRAIIEHAITHQPRSLQKRIGPSELGNPCTHCLAAKLAGWEQNGGDLPWLTVLGTAFHAWAEEKLNEHEYARNFAHTTGRRWLTEERVTVGQIGGVDITGSTDLVDLATGTVLDWKLVGPTTLRKVKAHGPSEQYRVQANAYAKGWNDAGVRIEHVAIMFLPRNDMRGLDAAIWWTEPHDRSVAEAALDRANQLHANLTALAALGATARDAWISSLPRDPDCFDCARFPDRPDKASQLAGLIS